MYLKCKKLLYCPFLFVLPYGWDIFCLFSFLFIWNVSTFASESENAIWSKYYVVNSNLLLIVYV